MSTRSERLKRRERGQAARERVLSGQYNQQPQTQQPKQSTRSSALAAYDEQKHQAVMTQADRSDRMMSTEDSSRLRKSIELADNFDRSERHSTTADSSKLRAEIEAPAKLKSKLPAEDRAALSAPKKPEKKKKTAAEKFDSNPVFRAVGNLDDLGMRAANRVGDFLGLGRGLDKSNPARREEMPDFLRDTTDRLYKPAETTAEKGADIVGEGLGYIAPTNAAYKLTAKFGGNLIKTPWARRLITGVVAEGGVQGAKEVAEETTGLNDQTMKERLTDVGIAGGLAGGLNVAAPYVARAFGKFMNRVRKPATEVEQQVTEMFALPAPRARGNANRAETPDVIYGPGRVNTPKPLGLPQGNVVPRTRLKPAGNDSVLDSVMQRIKPVVTERMTPPLENPNELAKWVQKHLGADISLNEIRRLPYEDLRQMAEMMRARLNVADEAHKAASELGYNLDEILNGNTPTLRQHVAQNAQERVYGVYPESLPDVRRPQFNREVVSGAAAPMERVGRAPSARAEALARHEAEQVAPAQTEVPLSVRRREAVRAQQATQTPSKGSETTPAQRPEQVVAEQTSHEQERLMVANRKSWDAWNDVHERFGDDGLKNPEKYLNESEIANLNRIDAERMDAERAYYAMRDTRKAQASAAEPRPIESSHEPGDSAIPQRINPIEQEAEEILQSVQQPRVRDRVYSYLDDAEKAARERLAKNGNRLSSTPVDVWTDYAIIGAAKIGKGTVKLADFTEEMVKEFGEQIRPHTQRIYNMAKEQLRQQERRASKEGQEAAAFNHSGTGNASTFAQKINRTPTTRKKEPWGKRWEKKRTEFTDDMAPLEGFEKRVRGGKLASAEDSLYKAARMFKGVPEKAAQIVVQRLSPIVEAIEKAGHTADDLGMYALAKHAKDVNAAGYKSGFTNSEIESVLIKYDSPEMAAAQKALVQVNRDMLQELVQTNVVSRELAEVLNQRWPNYIPLFRAIDDAKVDFESGLSKALANVANPIKALEGSDLQVIDPLENMVKNIYRSVNAAERNKVASQLPKLAAIDNEGLYIRKLAQNEEVGRKNVVNVKVNGENVKYEVEPEVYKAMLNLDQESSNMLINALAQPASWLRAGATLTPDFALRNPIRDVLQAFTVSKSGFNPFTDLPVGIVQAIAGRFGKGKLYQEWVEELGAYGNVMSMDRNVHRQALQKALGEPASKKVVNIVSGKSLIGLLRAISDTTESATKIGEYRAAIRSGASKQEAAYRSRDIMDFARAGTAIRPANRIIAFLNANIQGNSKLIRAFKENWKGTTVRAVVSVTLPTVGVFMMQKYMANDVQKDTIDNAPEWQKQAFWLVPIPGTDVVGRIPKPFGLNLVFANPVEHALEFFYNKDKKAFDGFAGDTLKGLALPTQISGLLPIYEGMSNYSFFRDGGIVPMREQDLPFRDQYDPVRTTETAKFLSKGAEKLTGGKGPFKNFSSPRIMDNSIQGFTGGLGKYITDAIDAVLQGTDAVDRPKAPAKTLEQKPLLRSFLVDPAQGGKEMDNFYELREKLSKDKSSAKLHGTQFDKDKQKKLDALERANDKLSGVGKMKGINTKIREIESSLMLTPKEKRQQIDELTAERKRIIREALAQVQ